MAKRYCVTLPIAGVVRIEVEAESERDAIKKALNGDDWPDDLQPEEWEVHRRITEGNVCHASVNDAYADLIDDGEDA